MHKLIKINTYSPTKAYTHTQRITQNDTLTNTHTRNKEKHTEIYKYRKKKIN